MSSRPRPPTARPASPDPDIAVDADAAVTAAGEHRVLDALVALAGALVPDFDVPDLMGELTAWAIELLGVTAAAVLLVDATGPRGLTVAAASSERTRVLEVFAVELSSGPCVDCVRTGAPVSSPIIEVDAARWPRFARATVEAGFRAVHVLPMRLRGDVVGALTLLHDVPRALDDADRRLGQTLADAATIGLLPHRADHHAEASAQQLQQALHRRVIVEQATGVLAQRHGLHPDDALAVLRDHARHHRAGLAGVCHDVVTGALGPGTTDASESAGTA